MLGKPHTIPDPPTILGPSGPEFAGFENILKPASEYSRNARTRGSDSGRNSQGKALFSGAGTWFALSRVVTVRLAPGIALSCVLLVGCVSQFESRNQSALSAAEARVSPAAPMADEPAGRTAVVSSEFEGSLSGYLAFALQESPEVHASFEDWKAATAHIPQTRRLPEPIVKYGYFIKPIQTRTGPQQQKIGIAQAFPWPTKLSAAADAAALAAESAGKRFEAATLDVSSRVSAAYWRLWQIRRSRIVFEEQLVLVDQLSSVVRGQMIVGKATLADLGQVDLRVTRLSDQVATLAAEEEAAAALLVSVVGAPEHTPTPTAVEPPAVAPISEDDATLGKAVRENPAIAALSLMAEAKSEAERSAAAERLPSFNLSVDYTIVGSRGAPDDPQDGDDALLAMVGIAVPIWFGVYGAKEDEARAQGRAFQARANAATNRALGALGVQLSTLRDAERRISLFETTLIPQADTVYLSVLGAFQIGRSTIVSSLMAQRDLLDLQLGLIKAQAGYAIAWARLEQLVGRPLKHASPSTQSTDDGS